MEKNSFILRGSGEPRASTAVPVEQRPRNPPVRGIFSSLEQLANRENARQLEDDVSRIDDSPSFFNDQSRLHRPFSNSRFTASRLASAEAPDVQPDERASRPLAQDNPSGQPSLHENRTDQSGCQENQESESHQSTLVISSYSDIQDIIFSSWTLKQLPDRLQEVFDRMKGDIENTSSELSKERRRSSSLSRDLEALRQELNESQEREKEAEIQISNQDRALNVESSNVERLQQENQKLKELSRRDREENEKKQSEMTQEIDALSKDLELAKRDIRYKDKFVGRIERDMKSAKKKFDEEVKRRKDAETESNAAKQEYIELQTSYREVKSQWKVLQEENEAQMTKLQGISESQREKISVLEVAVEMQKETTQAVESDLAEMVSFLRRISRAVGHVFRATKIHGCLSVPVTIDFPVSALILEEQEESYDIFERLVEALDSASSLSGVLQLANSYDNALKDFFRILVVRLVAQTEYICTKDETLRQIESCHTLIRARLQEQRQGLQELGVNFSAQLTTMQREMAKSSEQLCLKVKQIEEKKERVKLELQAEKDKIGVIISMLDKCKESLFHEKATFLDLKDNTAAHFQELETRISENATDTSSCRSTLAELKKGIESLFEACSVSRQERKTAEDISQTEIERLRNALADKEEKTNEMMKQAVADEEKMESGTTSLKEDMEKLMKEKSEVANKLADAEHALQQMSRTVAEALSAEQEALKEVIHEKSVAEQLRSELSKVSGKTRENPFNQGSPVEKGSRKASSAHLRGEMKEDTKGNPGQIQEALVEKIQRPPSAFNARRTSSTKMHRETPEADPCDDDLVPNKKKRRISNSHSRKSPRPKTTRHDASKPLTAERSSQLQNPKEVLRSKESVKAQPDVHGAPSKSGAARDEEWDIDLAIGKDDI